MPDTFLSSTNETVKGWEAKLEARGHKFIDIQKSHCDHFAIAHDCEPVEFDRVIGYSLVDRWSLPLAVAGFHFEKTGEVTIFAHLGQWMAEYPVPIMRLTKKMFKLARDLKIEKLYAVAEEQVGPKALSSILWAGGEPTGERCYFGDIYVIHLDRTPI